MSGYLDFGADGETHFDPAAVATKCIESGADALLLDERALPTSFFDLSTGVTGELLHRLSLYGIRLATVLPEPGRCSPPFQAFVREANRGAQFRFFPTREEAIRWLQSHSSGA